MSELVEEMRQQLAGYLAEHGKRQSKAAREMRVSTTTLSQFLSGTYPGDNEEVARKVKQFITMDAAREDLSCSPDYCPTLRNTKEITTAAKLAHVAKDISLVYGPAGCSKTTTLKHYAETNSNVIYAESDATTGSPRNSLFLVLEAMGEAVGRASTAQMMRTIISKLADTNSLLIIDEAQHLTERAVDTLRAITDKARIGVVFSGNPSILRQMYGRQEEEFDQVHSRIGTFCELKNIYRTEEIQAYFNGYQLEPGCIEYLRRIACQKGGLRLMDKHFRKANTIAKACGLELSLPVLEKASVMMNVARRAL